MTESILRKKTERKSHGFSLTEAVVATAIVGSLGTIAYPNYITNRYKSQQSEAKAAIASIPPIISAYVDQTGEVPATWDNLSSIAAVMTNNGTATGDLETPITLPNSIYDLSIEGPSDSVYTITATRVIDRIENNSNEEDPQYEYAIKSCFNISNGASDLKSGKLSDIENTLNCS